jgi:hypothetical protein
MELLWPGYNAPIPMAKMAHVSASFKDSHASMAKDGRHKNTKKRESGAANFIARFDACPKSNTVQIIDVVHGEGLKLSDFM